MQVSRYATKGGIAVTREIRKEIYQPADNALAEALDGRRGVLFSSSFEFPGRYTRWDMGFVDPPLMLHCARSALRDRGAEPARSCPVAADRAGVFRIAGDPSRANKR